MRHFILFHQLLSTFFHVLLQDVGNDIARHLKDVERVKATGAELSEAQPELGDNIDSTVGK